MTTRRITRLSRWQRLIGALAAVCALGGGATLYFLTAGGGTVRVTARPTPRVGGSPGAGLLPSPVPTVTIGVDQQAQRVVDSAPAGTAFRISSGVHHRFAVRPKSDDVFIGAPGAVLDGDGVTPSAFYATDAVSSNSVTIEGTSARERLVVRDYDNGGSEQIGAIQPAASPSVRANHWILRYLEVTGSFSRGVTTSDYMTVEDCLIDHNGRLGLGGSGDGVVVLGNEIAFNDTRNVAPGFENGGAKLSKTNGLLFRDNYVHDNTGPGIWTDIDADSSSVEDNTVLHNSGIGVLNEISHNTVIDGNRIIGNGWAQTGALKGAGIEISSSFGSTIYGNRLESNHAGIIALQANRGSGRFGPHLLDQLEVHDNIVDGPGLTGVVQSVGDPSLFTSRSLRFLRDHYQAARFVWMGHTGLSWAQWQADGQDPGGTWAP